MSAADNETIALQRPRVLDDAYKALTDARAALESAANSHAAAVHEHTEALSAARAAGLAGAADAESRGSYERDTERREHVARGGERRARERYRDAIESFEDGAAKARRWLADASASGASAESVMAAERAIDAAERRAVVERLQAEERGWMRRAQPAVEARAAAPTESSKMSGAGPASTTDTAPKKRRGLPLAEANARAREILKERPEISSDELAAEIPCATGQVPRLPAWRVVLDRRKKEAPDRSVPAKAMDPALFELIASQQADMAADEHLPARRVARQRKRLAD